MYDLHLYFCSCETKSFFRKQLFLEFIPNNTSALFFAHIARVISFHSQMISLGLLATILTNAIRLAAPSCIFRQSITECRFASHTRNMCDVFLDMFV